MTRLLLALLGLLAAAPVGAQPAAPPQPSTPPATASAAPTPTPARPRLVRRSQRIEEMPRAAEALPLLGAEQAATLAPAPGGELAPVPNRDIEGPTNRSFSMEARLVPEVFNRQMPGRGMTAVGVSNQREERVYAPAPGARISVPFFTR